MELEEEINHIFVYGTLLSQYSNIESHDYLKKYTEFIDFACMDGKLYMVDYYPGAIPCEKGEKSIVKGEVYKLTNPKLLFDFLDKYEEYNPEDPDHSEYVRKPTQVILNKSKQVITAWVYYFNQDTADLEFLPKGDFLGEYHK